MCVCPPKHPLSTIQNAELRTPGGIATNLRQHSTSISWVLLVLGKHHFFGGELFTDPQLPENAQDFFERSVLEKVTPARGRSERYSSWGLGNAPQRRMRIQWHDIQRAGVKKAKCSLEAMLGCEISEAPGLGASLLIWHDSHTTRRASIYHFSQWARVINKSCLLIHCSHCIWRFSSRSYKHK